MKILMVCLGNICRSPLAEGILKSKISALNLDWDVDSCGTSGFHSGALPDSRSIEVAAQNSIDITDQRSRQIRKSDLKEYDLIIAMDSSNYQNIAMLAETESEKSKVRLLLNYSFPGRNTAVPDPYYEGGFDQVYDMIDNACDALIEEHNVVD